MGGIRGKRQASAQGPSCRFTVWSGIVAPTTSYESFYCTPCVEPRVLLVRYEQYIFFNVGQARYTNHHNLNPANELTLFAPDMAIHYDHQG